MGMEEPPFFPLFGDKVSVCVLGGNILENSVGVWYMYRGEYYSAPERNGLLIHAVQ